jgi:DNA-binding response OmpR family regulator
MAASVEEALRQAGLAPPDLVILDDDLEGRGDRDVAELFREALPEAQIILLEPEASEVPRGAGRGLFSRARSRSLPGPSSASSRTPWATVSEVPPSWGPATNTAPSYASMTIRTSSDRFRDFLPGMGTECPPSTSPNFALLDIMMPGMDGLDLAEKIRETTRGQTPVVFVTALESEEAFYQGHERGGCYVLAKTDKPQKVLDVVDYLAGDLDESERQLLKSQP